MNLSDLWLLPTYLERRNAAALYFGLTQTDLDNLDNLIATPLTTSAITPPFTFYKMVQGAFVKASVPSDAACTFDNDLSSIYGSNRLVRVSKCQIVGIYTPTGAAGPALVTDFIDQSSCGQPCTTGAMMFARDAHDNVITDIVAAGHLAGLRGFTTVLEAAAWLVCNWLPVNISALPA